MRKLVSRVFSIVALPLVTLALAGCPGMTPMPMQTYSVTVENLTSGQPLSPLVAATHPASVVMWRAGQTASPGLEAIAEDGDNAMMMTALEGNALVTDVVGAMMPIVPMGSTAGGFSDAMTFEIEATPMDVLSLAGMLIATNDGIYGIDSVGLPTSGTKVIYALGYDAGTENNTEMSEDIVDPASALGPVMLEGDPNMNENATVDTTPQGVIALHPNIAGGGDLSVDEHGWDEPVARITITATGKVR